MACTWDRPTPSGAWPGRPAPDCFGPAPGPGRPGRLVAGAPLGWLVTASRLAPFDLAVLLAAAAPDLDLRYERVFAFLQDDVTARRPVVDLMIGLFNPDDRVRALHRFGPEAPLVRDGLVRLDARPDQPRTPLLGHAVRADGHVLDLLVGAPGVNRRLAGLCRVLHPGDPAPPPHDPNLLDRLAAVVADGVGGRPVRVHLQGPPGSGKRTLARTAAGRAGLPLLVAELRRAPAADLDELIPVVMREARLWGAAVYLNDIDALPAAALPGLAAALDGHPGVTFVAGEQAWAHGGGAVTLTVGVPADVGRRVCWQTCLAAAGIRLDEADVATLADRFRLTPGRIAAAADLVRPHRLARGRPADADPDVTDVFGAARAQSGHELEAVARRVEPRATWADLVLPADATAQLGELCGRAATRGQVLGRWGFGRAGARGTGTTALFAGPSGTGKTLAAEVVAAALGLDLFRVDLARVVSKWIGETEKNLDRVFAAAEGANAVLLFDEADALFGKRSEVKDARDRYANLEVSYLLQRMEEYAGVAILATNLRQHLDDAFVRRLAFCVGFPFPDEAHRRRIWAAVWPADAPLDADVDFDRLAREHRLSGGNIRNVALAAAHLAAAEGRPVGMADLRHAVRREFQKLGKGMPEVERNGTANGTPAEALA